MTQTPPAGLKHFKKVALKVFVSICHVPDWIVWCCLTCLIFKKIQLITRLKIFCSDHHNFNLLKGIAKK